MIRVYGASDDLIEVDGDIREEFNPNGDERDSVLAFSDGTVLTIQYTSEGIWRIARIAVGAADYSHTQAPPDEDENYSDVATLDGGYPIRWVLFANDWRLEKVA